MLFTTALSRPVVLLTLLLLLSGAAWAIDERYSAAPIQGNKLRKDSSSTVTDAVFIDPGLKPNQTAFKVRNLITFKVNEAANLVIPDAFTVELSFKVYFTRDNGSPSGVLDSTALITLNINYNKNGFYSFKAIHTFTGGHIAQLVIKDIQVTGGMLANLANVLMVENEILINREFNFSCTNNAVQAINRNEASVTTKGELQVYWAPERAADEYDLEWAYIDQSATANYKLDADTSKFDPRKLFGQNATRVSLKTPAYYIPLLYDNNGYLFYRVRSVQVKSNGQRIEANWSSQYTNGLGQYAFAGHENSLNWQATTSYAEDGKRKSVVQYFDGSLRGRQTVTKDNTTDTTIVAESFYDHQGRAVIQVLPSPSLSSIIKYTPNYNSPLNGSEYSKSLYDGLLTDSCYCKEGAPKMDSTKGTAGYYSPANQNAGNGYHKYIPDSKGYPFTETRYTPDNTGRIALQSGIGADQQIGKMDTDRFTHETKYYYGGADQEELDALFGTEVGKASHYFKNMVRDANGQYSVSYVDMHGRTIATALAGKPTSKLDTLVSNKSQMVTKRLLDSTNNIVKGTAIQAAKGLIVTKAGNHRFMYSLLPDSINIADCDTIPVCYDCLYDLEIRITDDCSNATLPGGQSIIFTATNLSYDTACNANTPFPGIDSSVFLREGSYLVTKTLTISQKALEFYRDSVFLRRNTCKTLEQFIQEQKDLLAPLACEPRCDSCVANLGNWDTFRERYMQQVGIAASDTAAHRHEAEFAFNTMKENCERLCDGVVPLHKSIREQMLADVSPPYGQYADPAKRNEFHNIFAPFFFYFRLYKFLTYYDEYGRPDSVMLDDGSKVPPSALSIEEFTARFKPSWATTLLSIHPEACKLFKYEKMATSHLWDERFAATETYQAAVDSGFLNPGNFAVPAGAIYQYNAAHRDPFFTDLLSGEVHTKYKENMQDSLRVKVRIGNGLVSMWALATMMAHCDAGDTVCMNTFAQDNHAFNPDSLCASELDIAWRYFREMYLQEKREIIYDLLTETCGEVSLDKSVYFVNFPDPEPLTQGSPTSEAAAKDTLRAFIDNNCIQFATQWWQELRPCSFSANDSAAIINRLIQVCKEGGDAEHVFGASTVKPSSTNPDRSFEQVLKAYAGPNYNSSCNVYLITAPPPFETTMMYYDKPLLQKPDTCECTTINTLYMQYQSYGAGDADFSSYLYRTRGAIISQGGLDTLRLLCNDQLTCNFLEAELALPPALQCGVQDICVDCGRIDTLYRRYKSEFPDAEPSLLSTDSLQEVKNRLFEHFMNRHLGFIKRTADYLNFLDTCAVFTVGSGPGAVDSLKKALYDYAEWNYKHFHGPNYDQSGCDTTFWVVNYSGREKIPFPGGSSEYDATVPLDQLLVNGYANHPKSAWPTTGNPNHVSFENVGDYCMGNGDFTYTERLKLHDTTILTSSKYNYIFLRFQNHESNNAVELDIRNNSLYIAVNGVWVAFPPPPPFTAFTFNDFHEVAVRFWGDSVSVYYDSVFVGTRAAVIDRKRLTYFYNALYSRNAYIDYIKLYDPNGNILLGEDFNGCNQTVLNLPIAQSPRCMEFFTNFFNQRFATTYTFNQIDSLYYQRTGKHVDVCADDCDVDCNLLKAKLNYFKEHYDSLVIAQCVNTGQANLVPAQGLACCQLAFKNYINQELHTYYSWNHLVALYSKCGVDLDICPAPALGPTLCGSKAVSFPPVTVKPWSSCDDSTLFAVGKGTWLYQYYRDSLTGQFEERYFEKCLNARYRESFTVEQPVSEYHYTLYYYDQAGNLVKTVPPEGVNTSKFGWITSWSDSVKTARSNKQWLAPVHALPTNYRFNTLNQVVSQHSPDGGLSEFWYDRLGRLVISRNAQQKAAGGGSEQNRLYNYTQYDHLGRIREVGQVKNTSANGPLTQSITRSVSLLNTWLTAISSSREQVTQTVYDLPYTGYVDVADKKRIIQQRNLRNRVSFTTYSDSGTGAFNQGTFYTYDIHGNVDTLLKDYGSSAFVPNLMNKNGNRWKKIGYNYDLISGKVNMVMYQRGWADEWYQRYTYDAENRVILAETSTDSLVWEKDARYEYYKHGPLARMVLGEQMVQGLDYAYTLQGWLKGINSSGGTIDHDMGGDGRVGYQNQYTARDAYGLTLNYYGDEYKPIGNVTPFPDYRASLQAAGGSFKPLYNGNISSMAAYIRRFEVGTGVPGGPLVFNNYSYDQLNRLTGQDAFTGFNTGANSWSLAATDMFRERVVYDANGNILNYLRNGAAGPVRMDSLRYFYYPGTNRLQRIRDSVPSNAYGANSYDMDIDNHTVTNNYEYDEIGNMTKDAGENITGIKWNVYGKITEITRASTGTVPITNIKYTYDAQGNRISKVFDLGGQKKYTWYVRDAQGNLLATYNADGNNTDLRTLTVSLWERYIYGASRLGYSTVGIQVDNDSAGPATQEFYHTADFKRGYRQYELSNHLGNVLSTISDKKVGVSAGGMVIDYYNPDIISANDYYPFGMTSRIAFSPNGQFYRYTFNGKENDWEAKGWQNQQDYGMRIYDPRIAKFLSVDPIANQYPWYTPYQFAGNTPIQAIDLDGLEPAKSYSWRDNPKEKLVMDNLGPKNHRRGINPEHIRVETLMFWGSRLVVPGLTEPRPNFSTWRDFATIGQYTPPRTEFEKRRQDEANKRMWRATGYTDTGEETFITKLEKNKHFTAFADNLALPMIKGYFLLSGAGEFAGVMRSGYFWLTDAALKRNIAFYAGPGAEATALAEGFNTLRQTRAGTNLMKLTEGMEWGPGTQAYDLSARFSAAYARSVPKGATVHVYLNNPSATSIWLRYEKPILEARGINIIEHNLY